MRCVCPLVMLLVLVVAQWSTAADPLPYELRVPQGFTVELVAGPDLVQHPTMAGFDPQGRLYVADNQGVNLRAAELLETLPNYIRRLEDTNGDGRFDRSTIFADKMTFPMGALWHDGWLYVASPPHIWRLRDTNDDGVADEREILVSEFGFTGNAADIHGCFLGPDGRIYWCDGRHGHNFIDDDGNPISKGLAARLFSCLPDGSNVEAFAGGGMDNPVEVDFTDEGEPLGTVAIFDKENGRTDAIIHWIHGGVYPHHPCVSEFQRTGGLLPAVSRFGRVAPSGIVRYRGRQFGPEYAGNLFSAHFNTHAIVRTIIERDGATFRSVDEPFLTCEHVDFHPTDVLEDADGSLLVIDTGGWFRIGCPNSEIAKPEVLGGIYRIRRTEAAPIDDPRGLKLDWQSATAALLVERLDDDRPVVRDRAVAQLAAIGEPAIEPLARVAVSAASRAARRNAVWALCRIGSPTARTALRPALDDPDFSVRLSAARACSSRRDAEALSKLLGLLSSDEPALRREAATALGRIGRAEAVPALVEAIRTGGDRFLEHALIFALIEINDRSATLPALADANPTVRRAALIALDQMHSGNLTREDVAPLLDTNDVPLQMAVLEIIERHPDWTAEMVSLVGGWLDLPELSSEQLALVRGAILAFRRDAGLQQLVERVLAHPATPDAVRLALLESVGRSGLTGDQLPAGWLLQLEAHLQSRQAEVVRQAVAAVAALELPALNAAVQRVAHDAQLPIAVRVAALSALVRGGHALDDAEFALLHQQLDEAESPFDRLAAADALGAAVLSAAQLKSLLPSVARAGPLELPALLSAFEVRQGAAGDEQLGSALLAAVAESPGLHNLTPARLMALVAGFPAEVQRAADELLATLNVDLAAQQARLEELSDLLAGGDPARGRRVFESQKTLCSACHRVGSEGGRVGPELTTIGQIRTPLALLEGVVFPSASFARGFESYTVVTTAGQVYTGVLAGETTDSVTLLTAQREEVRLQREQIEELVPSPISIMPQGLDRLMSPQELRDLLAYLQSLK